MRITIPHYFDFGDDRHLVGDDLVRAPAWDALRTQTSGPFALPETRERWEEAADERQEIAERARVIEGLLKQRRVSRVASYGAGAALIELWLNRLTPQMQFLLGEYAPETVERLRRIFTEAEVLQHDLLVDPPLDADLHLFHRIDTEFTNRQWRTILRRFRHESILVVATEILDWDRIIGELRQWRHRHGKTRAGLIRNQAAFEALWKRTHDATPLQMHDLSGWLLEPRIRT